MSPRSALLASVIALVIPTALPSSPVGPAPVADEARVTVTQEELRIAFPLPEGLAVEPSGNQICGEDSHDEVIYQWGILLSEASVGARGITALARGCQASGSRPDVVHRIEAGVHTPGMFLQLLDIPVEAQTGDGAVVLRLTDRTAIMDLFGLLPETVEYYTIRPGEARAQKGIEVEYLDPRIPTPDSAFRAQAARLQAEDGASRRSIRRSIDASHPGAGALWLPLGDSIPLWVMERVCNVDACSGDSLFPSDENWTVDDPSVVALRFIERDPPPWAGADARSRAFLHGIQPGRTMVRATGLESPSDTLMARVMPQPTAEAEVVVTERPAGVILSVQAESVRVGEVGWLRVTFLNEDGREFIAPARVNTHNGAWMRILSARPETMIHYDRSGTWRHVVEAGPLSDTVFVQVVEGG